MASLTKTDTSRPPLPRTASIIPNGGPAPPVTAPSTSDAIKPPICVLELSDGSAFKGISFGAEAKSVAGECVFQTGRTLS